MRAAPCRARMRRGGRRPLVGLLLWAGCVLGISLAALPLAQDLQAIARAERVIASVSDEGDRSGDPARIAALAQAQAYNARLAPGGGASDNAGRGGANGGGADIDELAATVSGPELAAYDSQLAWHGSGVICWVEIPKIGVREPVYRGTSEESLALGAGHLEWSSLPVGGSSTHCVLAAHSGMTGARGFGELDRLRAGDDFILHTLGDSYRYRVYETEVVAPPEARGPCAIVAGADLCTLMTCTPYGINSHRLLVHGRRAAHVAEPRTPDPTTLVRPLVGRRALPLALTVGGSCLLALAQRLCHSAWRRAHRLRRCRLERPRAARPGWR